MLRSCTLFAVVILRTVVGSNRNNDSAPNDDNSRFRIIPTEIAYTNSAIWSESRARRVDARREFRTYYVRVFAYARNACTVVSASRNLTAYVTDVFVGRRA